MQGNSKIKQNQEVQKNVKMFKKCRLEKNRKMIIPLSLMMKK